MKKKPEDFFDYLKNAREKFLAHIETMKPNLYTKDRVEIEDIIIAYDQAVEAAKGCMCDNQNN